MIPGEDCTDCLRAALGNPGAWECYRSGCTACGERMLSMLRQQIELEPEPAPKPPHKDKYL